MFKWDGGSGGRWRKLSEDNVQVELPMNTLLEVEMVQEMKGEVIYWQYTPICVYVIKTYSQIVPLEIVNKMPMSFNTC